MSLSNLRLVVLDYPKLIIRDEQAKKVLADMVQAKQINFERADEDYITMQGLDMISTHFLIYDTTDIYNPKPVLAIRNCYSDRAEKHNLGLPFQSYMKFLTKDQRKEHEEFRRQRKIVVDCNSWFVDVNFSKANSGLALSDLGYFMVVSHILRRGIDHVLGTTNEKFKASRWVEPIGDFSKDTKYIHPQIGTEHMVILCSPFNYDWYLDCCRKYGELYDNRVELAPENQKSKENLLSDREVQEIAQRYSNKFEIGVGEADAVMTERIAS